MKADVFTKPYIKSRDLQERIASELTDNPEIGNIAMAETLYDWFMDLEKGKQIEIFSYAISHLRPNVEKKLNGKGDGKTRAAGERAAKRLILIAKVRWFLSMTYDQIDDTLKIGAQLKERMKPGQRVSDVWTNKQIERLLK